MDYDLLWHKIGKAFPLLDKSVQNIPCSDEELQESFEIVKSLNFHHHVETLVFNEIEKNLRQIYVPKFWTQFEETDNEIICFYKFKNAVETLYTELSTYAAHITNIQKLYNFLCISCNIIEKFKLVVRASLLAQLPPHHSRTLKCFYEISFRVFCNLEDDKQHNQSLNSTGGNSICGGCLQDNVQCQCQKIYDIFCDTNRWLVELNLLEPLAGQVIMSLIHIRIENYIQQICKGSFDVSYTQHLEKWLNSTVMSWLYRVYCIQSIDQCDGEIRDSMQKYHQKLTHFLYETYTMTRINQLFNIIIEYPDSLPAVEDLHNCLPKTDLRPVLISKLQKALETRLLHPGVSTPDILTAYVAAIRSLRELDPSGVLLDLVTQPVHQYLRSREDTVRCVVGSLTEEGPSDLADELAMAETLNDENNPEENDENWELWKPDPIDVVPAAESSPKHKRTSDIISMLVNVYGSKELFVNEYKTLLADRLLSQYNCNTEKEVRYLELLKLRFGETQLHYCEVMLKDITDSKRINGLLQKDEQYKEESKNFPVTSLILSAQFWPSFKEETLELPASIKEQFQFYTTAFETLKGNRTLCWKPHLGSVDLDIELRDRTISLTVSPIHATIIMHFQEQEQWTIDDLSQVMKVPATLLRKKISFWQSQGVLKEISSNVFLLIEESASKGKASTSTDIVCEDDEAESVMASYQDQREEELQVFWSYIIGMLTNLDSMTLERIHQMLKMFASQGPSSVECSLQELRVFLDRKVREHKLLLFGGYYRLPKS